MERVQLTDRPGSFFVVCRLLGQVRLLDAEDKEFTVHADQVVKEKVVIKPRKVGLSSSAKPTTDFSQYAEFISFLVARRGEVSIYFSGKQVARTKIMNRYLELTGEELGEEFIFKVGEEAHSWDAPRAIISFPIELPNTVLLPAERNSTAKNGLRHRISNVNFAWHLIEHHGFRANVRMSEEEKNARRHASQRRKDGDLRGAEC